MKRLLARLRALLIRFKVYLSRTASYISMLNTVMILFLLLSNLERYNIDIDIQQWLLPLFLIGFSLMLLFGYLEDKFGFYTQEQKTVQAKSPVFKEIIDRLDRIEKKL